MNKERLDKLIQAINAMSPEDRAREIEGLKKTLKKLEADRAELVRDLEFVDETIRRLRNQE